MEFIHHRKKEIDLLRHGQVGADGQTVHTEGTNFRDGALGFIHRAAIMQGDGISHAGKGQGKGFAEPVGGPGHKG